jgi:hypothetical protein
LAQQKFSYKLDIQPIPPLAKEEKNEEVSQEEEVQQDE